MLLWRRGGGERDGEVRTGEEMGGESKKGEGGDGVAWVVLVRAGAALSSACEAVSEALRSLIRASFLPKSQGGVAYAARGFNKTRTLNPSPAT